MQYIYADTYEIYYYFIKWDNDSLLEPIRGLAQKMRYTLNKYGLGAEIEVAAEATNNNTPNKLYITYPTKQTIRIFPQDNQNVTFLELSIGEPEKTVEKDLESTKLYPRNLRLEILNAELKCGYRRYRYSGFTYIQPDITLAIKTDVGEITAKLYYDITIEYLIERRVKTLYGEVITHQPCTYRVTLSTNPQTTAHISDLATGEATIHIIKDTGNCRSYLQRNRFKIATEMAHALDTLLETNKLLIKELQNVTDKLLYKQNEIIDTIKKEAPRKIGLYNLFP